MLMTESVAELNCTAYASCPAQLQRAKKEEEVVEMDKYGTGHDKCSRLENLIKENNNNLKA